MHRNSHGNNIPTLFSNSVSFIETLFIWNTKIHTGFNRNKFQILFTLFCIGMQLLTELPQCHKSYFFSWNLFRFCYFCSDSAVIQTCFKGLNLVIQIILLSVPSKMEALPLSDFAGRVSQVFQKVGMISVVLVTPIFFCNMHPSSVL